MGEFRRDRIALLRRVRAECGDLGAFHLGPRRVIVASSPELAYQVLVEHAGAFEKGPTVRDFARPLFGDGLITIDNAQHKGRRRTLGPAFSARQLAAYAGAMSDDVTRAADRWAEGAAIELGAEMTSLTLRIVGRALFSVDLASEADPFREALDVLQRHVAGRIKSLAALPLFVPTAENRAVRAAIRRLDETIYRLIAERRAALGRHDHAPPPGADLLTMLVLGRDPDSGGPLSDRQIRDEAMNLLVAGHETTAHALTWTWSLLMRHPDVYAALEREIDEVLPGRAPTPADVPRLRLTIRIFKEALRLYPPVHSIGREASRDVAIGGHRLERGALVIVSAFLIHRRDDLYPRPDDFAPGRFDDDAEARLPRLGYLPFGAGPRVCIGNHFAMMEAIAVLAGVAQRARLSPVSPAAPAPEMLITLRPAGPIGALVRLRRGGTAETRGDPAGHRGPPG